MLWPSQIPFRCLLTYDCIKFSSLRVSAPHEFTQVPFAVKALKIIVHDLQSGGESATITAAGGYKGVDVESDDGVCDISFLLICVAVN